MDKLSIWKDFIANRKPNQQQFEHTGILVILQDCATPQPLYSKLAFGNKYTREEIESLGYVYDENGLIERSGRICFSKDMVAIRDWADKWDMDHSFYPKSASGCFFTADRKKNKAFMEMHTYNDNVIDALKEFPHKDAIIKTIDLMLQDEE